MPNKFLIKSGKDLDSESECNMKFVADSWKSECRIWTLISLVGAISRALLNKFYGKLIITHHGATALNAYYRTE